MTTKNINEYAENSCPKWIAELTKEQQYARYVDIKKSLPQLRKLFGDTVELEKAILEYEKRNNIQ